MAALQVHGTRYLASSSLRWKKASVLCPEDGAEGFSLRRCTGSELTGPGATKKPEPAAAQVLSERPDDAISRMIEVLGGFKTAPIGPVDLKPVTILTQVIATAHCLLRTYWVRL